MINVLLVSPHLSPNDPRRCGDHAYTDTLLENPPPGVRYWHYEGLIADGKMKRIRHLQLLGHNLTRAGFLPPDMWAEYLTTQEQPDLVHVVAFAATVRIPGPRVPLVLHASSPSITDLTVKRNWSDDRVSRAYARKRAFLRMAKAHHYALNADAAATVLVQTEYGRRLLLEYGQVAPERVHVLYPAQPVRVPPVRHLPDDRACSDQENRTTTFLFVGSDFERKNGPLVVDAFSTVREKVGSQVRLVLVGRPNDGHLIKSEGIEHHMFVDHERLLDSFFSTADVFVLPTAAEGSFAFTLFEAMSSGLPAITVDAWAMPEIIQDGVNGFLVRPNSRDDLVDRMLRLVTQPELLVHMKLSATRVFHERFSIEAHNHQLKRVYDEVLSFAQR